MFSSLRKGCKVCYNLLSFLQSRGTYTRYTRRCAHSQLLRSLPACARPPCTGTPSRPRLTLGRLPRPQATTAGSGTTAGGNTAGGNTAGGFCDGSDESGGRRRRWRRNRLLLQVVLLLQELMQLVYSRLQYAISQSHKAALTQHSTTQQNECLTFRAL
jgi:hypothetical protein